MSRPFNAIMDMCRQYVLLIVLLALCILQADAQNDNAAIKQATDSIAAKPGLLTADSLVKSATDTSKKEAPPAQLHCFLLSCQAQGRFTIRNTGSCLLFTGY